MIRWLTLFTILLGFLGIIIIGRALGRNRHFFWKRLVVHWGLLLVVVVVALLPLSNPTTTKRVSSRDILFVVDTTLSMNAEDGRGGSGSMRLQNVRDDIGKIASDNVGASMGIFTFSDVSTLYLPLTSGSEDIQAAAKTIYTATQFQAIPKVKTYASVLEDVGKYLEVQQKADPTRQRTVIMMSDFEIYNNQEQVDAIAAASKGIKSNNASFVALVYGQDSGAKIVNMAYDYQNSEQVPAYVLYGDDKYTRYLYQNAQNPVSKPNPDVAAKLAASLTGESVRASDESSVVPAVKKAIERAQSSNANNPQSVALRQNSLYVIPAFIGFLWLCTSELIRPGWLVLFTRHKSKAQSQVSKEEPAK